MKIEQRKSDSFLFKAIPYRREPKNMSTFHKVNTGEKVKPEHDLVTFYLATHLLNEIEMRYEGVSLSPEQAEIVDSLYADIEQVFQRMFTYVMLISIGESRHGKIKPKMNEIINEYGHDVWELAKKIEKTSRSESRFEFLQSDRELLTFMEYCDWMFISCFWGGSIGGPRWRDISHKVTQVLTGEISPYIMVDASWAMVHNTGSIFNKNTIYYQAASFEGLTQLLDMQRGGAIPALVSYTPTYSSMGISSAALAVTVEHGDTLKKAKANFDLSDVDKIMSLPEIKQAGALSCIFQSTPASGGSGVVAGTDLSDDALAGKNLVATKKIQVGPTQIQMKKRSSNGQ